MISGVLFTLVKLLQWFLFIQMTTSILPSGELKHSYYITNIWTYLNSLISDKDARTMYSVILPLSKSVISSSSSCTCYWHRRQDKDETKSNYPSKNKASPIRCIMPKLENISSTFPVEHQRALSQLIQHLWAQVAASYLLLCQGYRGHGEPVLLYICSV